SSHYRKNLKRDSLHQKKFSIPKRGEAWIVKSLGNKWKDYKCELKSEYTRKYKTKDALLKNRPSRIPRDQWSGLVSYWLSDKAKRRTQANRNNRAKQTMPHTGGSKSIATLMNEQAVNGIEPTRAEIFILTHKKRKYGRPLDDDSAKTIVRFILSFIL
uniref:Transposase n=1 Tax=Nicotiana tabacum TaxID=4097 RepID=A0A1S4AGT0_TOBAC